MKAKITLLAAVSLSGPLTNAQGVTVQTHVDVEHQSMDQRSIDQITVRLTQAQREDLLTMLKMMGAEIGDWKTYSSSLAPSKCTVGSE